MHTVAYLNTSQRNVRQRDFLLIMNRYKTDLSEQHLAVRLSGSVELRDRSNFEHSETNDGHVRWCSAVANAADQEEDDVEYFNRRRSVRRSLSLKARHTSTTLTTVQCPVSSVRALSLLYTRTLRRLLWARRFFWMDYWRRLTDCEPVRRDASCK